jgi:outer membrane protein assembly factor BamD
MHARILGGRPVLLLLLGLGLPLVQGCGIYEYIYGGPTRREAARSDQDLLRSAEAQLERRKYDDARKDLQQLINQYPESELLSAARLASAKSLYLARKYEEARTEYQRFLELHPQHDRTDEAHYYLGMTYFRQSDTADRDQSTTRKALDEFDILVKQMPDSQYVADARERIGVARRKLAEKEAYIGAFYFHRGEYAAASARFGVVLSEYPGAGFDDQALYYLGESLWQLEQKASARTAFQRLVDEHSQSPWAAPAARRLDITLVRTGPPLPPGPGLISRMWSGMKESWTELLDTVRDYQIFR